jgi:hypothetical protein
MMDIPVLLCQLCYQVLPIRGFNPVREFFNKKILDFLAYNTANPRGFGAVETDPDRFI